MPRTPLPCPACGAAMNRHAEKLFTQVRREELAGLDVVMYGVLEEHHLCPRCGWIECLRVAS